MAMSCSDVTRSLLSKPTSPATSFLMIYCISSNDSPDDARISRNIGMKESILVSLNLIVPLLIVARLLVPILIDIFIL